MEPKQTTTTNELSRGDLTRFSRHIILPEIGVEGQKKLKAARILIVGVGGLGSPAALYLAAAGVGTIGLADHDVVELSNLQRQILYTEKNIGLNKTSCADAALKNIDSNLNILVYQEKITALNAESIVKSYDVVIDGTDNFASRFVISDACAKLEIPYVYGSIFRFEGQASVFSAKVGPCLRCFYSEAPPADQVPSCGDVGVLGVLPGIIGVIQATEAIKIILQIGTTLLGRLLVFQALEMRFQEIIISKNTECVLCGRNSSRKLKHNTDQMDEKTPTVHTLSVKELYNWRNKNLPMQLIDVRKPEETAICAISGSLNIPLENLAEQIDNLERSMPIILFCKSGVRSMTAAKLIRKSGYANVYSLNGGIKSWISEIDPTQASY